jgi:mannose-1-phosphate guanylyltransferase/phosphomannomutase
MKAIIVAGGEGKRLKPLTENIPKPMIKVGGIPLLEHTIRLLKEHNITDIILALCYLPEPIVTYFGDGSQFGVTIHYTFENVAIPLGTAGAILPAQQYINETCIVTYADIIRDLDITKMIASHHDSKSLATLNVYKHTGKNFKSTLVFDKNSALTSFTEQGTSTTLTDGFVWSNGSFYIIEPEVFNYIEKNTPTDFAKDIFQKLLQEDSKVSVFPSDGYFIDIGTIETLKQAEIDIVHHMKK